MEHTFKIEKELKITTENIVDCVLSCEAGGFDYLEDKKKGAQAVDKSAEYLDAMSAIICVIDYEKFKRGLGV